MATGGVKLSNSCYLGSYETIYLLFWLRISLYFHVSLWYRNGPNEWKLGLNPTPVGFRSSGGANQWGASTLSDKLIGYFKWGQGFQLKTSICINWIKAWVIETMDSRLDKFSIGRHCLKSSGLPVVKVLTYIYLYPCLDQSKIKPID